MRMIIRSGSRRERMNDRFMMLSSCIFGLVSCCYWLVLKGVVS